MIARIQKAMKEKDGGFTLVELIVVVLIIGVLAAIAVPVFMNQSDNAKRKSDLAALSNAKIAVSSYISSVDTVAAAPSASDLQNYGFPQSPAITVSGATSAGAYTLTLTANDSASKKACTATATTGPSCLA